MHTPLHASTDCLVSQFWRDQAYLRQEFSRMGAATMRGGGLDATSLLEARLAREFPRPEDLHFWRACAQTVKTRLATTVCLRWMSWKCVSSH